MRWDGMWSRRECPRRGTREPAGRPRKLGWSASEPDAQGFRQRSQSADWSRPDNPARSTRRGRRKRRWRAIRFAGLAQLPASLGLLRALSVRRRSHSLRSHLLATATRLGCHGDPAFENHSSQTLRFDVWNSFVVRGASLLSFPGCAKTPLSEQSGYRCGVSGVLRRVLFPAEDGPVA